MAYCTAAQVQAIVVTDIPTADITELIEETDAWLDIKLDTGSLNANFLRMLSRTITAVRCMLRDPQSQALGEYREDREYALQKLNAMIEEWMRDADGMGGISYHSEALPF